MRRYSGRSRGCNANPEGFAGPGFQPVALRSLGPRDPSTPLRFAQDDDRAKPRSS